MLQRRLALCSSAPMSTRMASRKTPTAISSQRWPSREEMTLGEPQCSRPFFGMNRISRPTQEFWPSLASKERGRMHLTSDGWLQPAEMGHTGQATGRPETARPLGFPSGFRVRRATDFPRRSRNPSVDQVLQPGQTPRGFSWTNHSDLREASCELT
jgi:hypothetical protein